MSHVSHKMTYHGNDTVVCGSELGLENDLSFDPEIHTHT